MPEHLRLSGVLAGLPSACLVAALVAAVGLADDVPDLIPIGSGAMGSADRDRSASETGASEIIVCPDRETIDGFDVSQWQGNIDWATAGTSGREFVFIRVSDGASYPDTQFDANWAGALSAGIVRGPYQYFRASEDPMAQADLILQNVDFGAGDLPPVLDVETLDGQSAATVLLGIQAWADRIIEVSGLTPIIYSGTYFWEDQLGGPDFSEFPFYAAHYGVTCPNIPDSWTIWAFWQNTASGSVPGVPGSTNLDVFNGSLADLEAFIDNSRIPLFADDFETGGTTEWSGSVL